MARLLVSDDDPHILKVIAMTLERAGHDVIATADPREVHAMACSTDPDAIILDVVMPVSGFELLGGLRQDPRTASVPILLLSGLAEGADRVRGLREGADDYLVKPFEPAELVLRVERLVSWRSKAGSSRGEPEPADATRFGRYEVLGVLGEGSMGTVYRGHDPRLERQVALKTLRLDAAPTDSRRRELLDRLRQEAVTIARLGHPNVIAVYDMGDTASSAFVAMELVDGVSLREYLEKRGPLPAELLVPLALAVAEGLARSHEGHVVHRDVKPGNVLLGRDGSVKVTDFGLAFVLSSLSEDSTELSGTPGYVPPEVLDQRPYTERGDVFGLGATLYEAAAGVHPLAGATLRDTILNTLHGRIRPLGEVVPEMPEELAGLIMELLALDPQERPSARQTVARLERMVAAGDLRWRPDDLPEPAGGEGPGS